MTAQTPYALQNASHSAALFRQAVHSAWQAPGVVSSGEYAVSAQSTPNMSVQVAGGRAWIKGTQVSNVTGQSFSTQSAYFGLNDAPITVTIATANATNPRIDLVYVAINDSFYSGSTNNLTIGVVTGTPAASPVAPPAPSNSLTLATVAVAANATSITNSNITAAASAALVRGAQWTPVAGMDGTNSGFSWGVPASMTTVPAASSTVTIASGQQLEVEFRAPKLSLPSGADARFQLLINGSVYDYQEHTPGSGTSTIWPVQLRAVVNGLSGSISIAAQGSAAAGSPVLSGNVVGPYFRYRVA